MRHCVKNENNAPGDTITLRQFFELIRTQLVANLARTHGVEEKTRTFTLVSHVVCLLFEQLANALSLDDVFDPRRLLSAPLRVLLEPPAFEQRSPPWVVA
jgi:hypothetical protein